ncbi:hypothetical protein COS83_03915 [archaeon CG07_land_8_20_14_0_80_38_8]|nr:MAG: hypothetical protein COS83_03915 [archaeon CG07_land_8_20_14_0_80_38_8]
MITFLNEKIPIFLTVMNVKIKGTFFEEKVVDSLNPYNKSSLDYFIHKYSENKKFRANGNEYFILTNEVIAGHEIDLAIVDKEFIELLDSKPDSYNIRSRLKGYFLLGECKNYNGNIPKSISSDLLAKNYLLNPDKTVLFKEDCSNSFNWVKNFEVSGVELVNYDRNLESELKHVMNTGNTVREVLENSDNFFRSNEERLKEVVNYKSKFNKNCRNEELTGEVILFHGYKSVIDLNTARFLAGESISFNSPIIAYYLDDCRVTDNAVNFLDEVNDLFRRENNRKRVRLVKGLDSGLAEKIMSKFENKKFALNINFYNKIPGSVNDLFYARIPAAVII